MMFILALLSFSFSARAQLQNPPHEIMFKPKPVLSKEIPCNELVKHIQEWGQFRADADIAVASYGEQLNGAVDSWVKKLKPIEGKPVQIEAGFFKPVEEGSQSLQEAVPLIYENSDYFDEHLKKVIIPTLEKCFEEKANNGSSRNN